VIKLKILLIYPPFPSGKGMSSIICSPPLNVLTLAGAITEHTVDILDLNVDKSYGIKEMKKKLGNYDLVGITCMSPTFRIVLNICRLAKRKNVKTVLGGFHPTLDPSIIDKYDSINMIVRGEGEITFKELLDGKPKKEILGLSYRENGKVYHNPDRPYIKNLDELPFPRNDLVDPSPYQYTWMPSWVCETSRGCPFTCSFCCVHEFYKRTYRTKTPERVIKELYQVPKQTKLVFFVDDNFTLNKKRVMRICKLLKKSRLNKKLMFVCQSRVDDIANNPDMVKEMHESGFICFFLGFESLKQASLDDMKKAYSLDKVRKCIDICHYNGIIVFGSFIIGNIGETKEDTLTNFRLMKEVEIDFMMTNPITPFPGTQLYTEAVEKGWVEKDFKWADRKVGQVKPPMATPDLTQDDIQELLMESYHSFYDLEYHLKKSIRGIFRYYPAFNWTFKHLPKFLKGAIGFVRNLDEIVGDEYKAID